MNLPKVEVKTNNGYDSVVKLNGQVIPFYSINIEAGNDFVTRVTLVIPADIDVDVPGIIYLGIGEDKNG